MIKNFLLPVIFAIIFVLESVFVGLLPQFGYKAEGVFVPHFLFIALLFSSIFVNRNLTLIYAVIFGFLYDLFYTGLLGVYAYLFPLTIYIISLLMKSLQQNTIILISVGMLAITFLEFIVYGIVVVVQQSSMPMEMFLQQRLFATYLLNLIFLVLFTYLFKRMFQKIHILLYKE